MSIDPRTRIGHVHLTVSDLDRSLAFYRDVLGFEETARYGREDVLFRLASQLEQARSWADRRPPVAAP